MPYYRVIESRRVHKTIEVVLLARFLCSAHYNIYSFRNIFATYFACSTRFRLFVLQETTRHNRSRSIAEPRNRHRSLTLFPIKVYILVVELGYIVCFRYILLYDPSFNFIKKKFILKPVKWIILHHNLLDFCVFCYLSFSITVIIEKNKIRLS